MKQYLILALLALAPLAAKAEMLYGVQLFDMYKVENVKIMNAAEFKELKEFIAEEKRVFNKAVSLVKAEWNKQYNDARKMGDKDFPKYPTKPYIFVRSFKVKNFTTREAADAWYAKQQARVDAWMSAEAGARQAAAKAGKGSVTAGYSSRDDKKAKKHAAKNQMDSAVKEKLGEFVELKMCELLKYNRPVPKHFVIDPMQGTSEAKNMGKKVEAQEKAWKRYLETKAAAEAAAAAGGTAAPAAGAAPAAPAAPAKAED